MKKNDIIDGTEKYNEWILSYHRLADLFGLEKSEQNFIDQPHKYFEEHTRSYEERGISSDASDDTMILIGLVDILIHKRIAFEFDYAVELEDFIWGMEQILGDRPLHMEDLELDEDEDITDWTKTLTDSWREQGYLIAALDIDSDSYVTFVCPVPLYEQFVENAGAVGHKISLAQDM